MIFRLSQARDAARDEALPRERYPAPPRNFDQFIPDFAFDASLIERVVNNYLYPTIYIERGETGSLSTIRRICISFSTPISGGRWFRRMDPTIREVDLIRLYLA